MPTIIADNAGYDSAELVSLLRNKHHLTSNCTSGLNMTNGTVGDMKEMGITEPLKLKLQVSMCERASVRI